MTVETMLVLGGMIAALVAILKAAFPALPSRALPLVVLAISAGVVMVGAASGEVTGSAFALLQAVVGQTVTALGLREGVVAAVPRASGGLPK